MIEGTIILGRVIPSLMVKNLPVLHKPQGPFGNHRLPRGGTAHGGAPPFSGFLFNLLSGYPNVGMPQQRGPRGSSERLGGEELVRVL